MLLKYVGVVSIILLITCSNSYPAEAQNRDAGRKDRALATRRIKNVELEGRLRDVLGRLSLDYDIPLGLEISSDEQLSNHYRVELSEGTIADLMGQIINQNERYDWLIENGVVNIFPRDKYRNALLAELLTVRIGSFTVDKNSDCWALQNDLINIPEIKAVIDAHGMQSYGADFSGFYIPQLGQNFSLTVSDISMKALLNRIIRESPLARTWIVNMDSSSRILTIRVNARQERAH
jgi:hypothetical protein